MIDSIFIEERKYNGKKLYMKDELECIKREIINSIRKLKYLENCINQIIENCNR